MTPKVVCSSATCNDIQRLHDILDHNSDVIWESDAQGRVTYCSAMVTQVLGYLPSEVIGKTIYDFMSPTEAQRVRRTFAAIGAAEQPFAGVVHRNLRKDGSVVVLETSGVRLFAPDGSLRGYRGIDRVISDLGERFLQLEDIYHSAPVAQGTVDREGRFMLVNQAMAELFGGSVPALLQQSVAECIPLAWQRLQADFQRAADGVALQHYEFAWQGRWFHAISHAVHDALGRVMGLSVVWTDITACKQAEQRLTEANRLLEHYARQDYLTGLCNRRYLDERLASELARTRREGLPLSLCMIDVDFFKDFNDSMGHIEGDECLRAVAQALLGGVARPGDIVGRYGGEEFAVVLCATDEAGAWVVAERLRAAVAALQLPHQGSPWERVSVSLGVVTVDPRWMDASDPLFTVRGLLRAADAALYDAKGLGRNRVVQHATPAGGEE